MPIYQECIIFLIKDEGIISEVRYYAIGTNSKKIVLFL